VNVDGHPPHSRGKTKGGMTHHPKSSRYHHFVGTKYSRSIGLISKNTPFGFCSYSISCWLNRNFSWLTPDYQSACLDVFISCWTPHLIVLNAISFYWINLRFSRISSTLVLDQLIPNRWGAHAWGFSWACPSHHPSTCWALATWSDQTGLGSTNK
jgi:hypothetical protein